MQPKFVQVTVKLRPVILDKQFQLKITCGATPLLTNIPVSVVVPAPPFVVKGYNTGVETLVNIDGPFPSEKNILSPVSGGVTATQYIFTDTRYDFPDIIGGIEPVFGIAK